MLEQERRGTDGQDCNIESAVVDHLEDSLGAWINSCLWRHAALGLTRLPRNALLGRHKATHVDNATQPIRRVSNQTEASLTLIASPRSRASIDPPSYHNDLHCVAPSKDKPQ
jgi:hypothetical protein